MDGLVDEDAAALGGEAAPPAALGVIGGLPLPGDEGPGPQELAGPAGIQQMSEQLDTGVIAVLEAHAHPDGGLLQGLEVRPLGAVHHRGFFGEHVDAFFRGQPGHGGVEVVGGADVEAVQALRVQHSLQGVVRGAAEGLGEGVGAVGTDVGAGDKVYALQIAKDGAVDLGDAAAAHQAYPKVFHITAPPLPGRWRTGFL